jgi:hypothetical protein
MVLGLEEGDLGGRQEAAGADVQLIEVAEPELDAAGTSGLRMTRPLHDSLPAAACKLASSASSARVGMGQSSIAMTSVVLFFGGAYRAAAVPLASRRAVFFLRGRGR